MSSGGKRQFNLDLFGGGEPFMMLPSDMALYWDPEYRKYINFYDQHRREFKRDAAKVFKKLVELGCSSLRPEQASALPREQRGH